MELLKAADPTSAESLTAICAHVWTTGHIPDDWCKGIILPFYKEKGSRHDCRNYCGITLLSVLGSVNDCALIAEYSRVVYTTSINGSGSVSYTHLTLPTNREV